MDDFYHLMAQAGFNRLSLAKWLGVSERTINRWIKHGAPLVAIRALELRAGYDHQWRGFRFIGREVITPAGDRLDKSRVELFHWLMAAERDIARDQERQRLEKAMDAKWQRYFATALPDHAIARPCRNRKPAMRGSAPRPALAAGQGCRRN